MPAIEHLPIYDDLVTLLAKYVPVAELQAFQLSPDRQQQLDDLLEKNRAGNLTAAESAELDAFEQFEHLVRLLKVRVSGSCN